FGGYALTYALMLTGAIMVWKLKKLGFFLYVGGNILNIVLPLAFGLPFDILGTVIVIIFIVLYFLNLKHLK
ncbi:MAG: hypothetical protein ACK452_09365, partial [Bacteroidota bacterium]